MLVMLGDVVVLRVDLMRRTGCETVLIDDAERFVLLTFSWLMELLYELLEEFVRIDQALVYVVHFMQVLVLECVQLLFSAKLCTCEERDVIVEVIGVFCFIVGFGKTFFKLVRNGIGVHHVGMLPRYRWLVEQFVQTGLLKVICGIDTFGVGINVLICIVVFIGLVKFDGMKFWFLKVREFHQIVGCVGCVGFDTVGYVVVQVFEYVIENARMVEKVGDDLKKLCKIQCKKPFEGTIVWNEEIYEWLCNAMLEVLVSRMRVNHVMIFNVVNQLVDPLVALGVLMEDNHEDERGW